MDLDALFILLQPWLRPFLAFVFFTAKHPLNTEKTC